MGPQLAAATSGRYLSFSEREDIAVWRAQQVGVREIARRLGRAPSTISRELRRNASTRSYRLEYRASTAQWHAARRARRPKIAKLAANERLREYVQDRLAGLIRAPDGTVVAGPVVPRWKGRNKPHRADRRWARSWSPEQIANRLLVECPDDESMRISHEAIYQALFVQGRGRLDPRAGRLPAHRTCVAGPACSGPAACQRSRHPRGDDQPAGAEVADRAVPGHWEGDLIIGVDRSAIGTLVERTTRFTMLSHLPRMAGYGLEPRVKNGPALAGYGAEAMREAIAARITTLPDQLRRPLTWDRGKELAQHAQLRIDADLQIYFADPHSPWQRGTNENTVSVVGGPGGLIGQGGVGSAR